MPPCFVLKSAPKCPGCHEMQSVYVSGGQSFELLAFGKYCIFSAQIRLSLQ